MYAMILAGGQGERLRPLTDRVPKPMVEVLGKPILWYQVQWLRQYGVTHFMMLVGYKWEAIEEYFGDGSSLGVKIEYSVEHTPLGRGGAFRRALSQLPASEGRVIATNGDVLCAQDIRPMMEQHIARGCLATAMLVPLVSPFGIVEVDDKGLVSAFREKPRLPHWINGGVYILNREIEGLLPELGDHEDSTFPSLAAQGKLGAFKSEAFWKSVDTFKDLREAEEAVRGGALGQ